MKKALRFLFKLININVFPKEDERTVELSKIENDPNHVKVTVRNKRTGEEIYNYRFVVFNEQAVAALKAVQQRMAQQPLYY
jgi:hypothetical protein